MCWSEKCNSKVLKKFCMQKMRREYWSGIGVRKKLCDEVEYVREFTYHGDRMSASGGCEAAVNCQNKMRVG